MSCISHIQTDLLGTPLGDIQLESTVFWSRLSLCFPPRVQVYGLCQSTVKVQIAKYAAGNRYTCASACPPTKVTLTSPLGPPRMAGPPGIRWLHWLESLLVRAAWADDFVVDGEESTLSAYFPFSGSPGYPVSARDRQPGETCPPPDTVATLGIQHSLVHQVHLDCVKHCVTYVPSLPTEQKSTEGSAT